MQYEMIDARGFFVNSKVDTQLSGEAFGFPERLSRLE